MSFRSGLLMLAFGLGAFRRVEPRMFLTLHSVEPPRVRDGQKAYFHEIQGRHAARFPRDTFVSGYQAIKTRQHHNSVRRSSMTLKP
ncbi:MAG: hypothetical protein HYS17_07180 [Micavibrio aeruginosavorus]|uniref:Uncharacterized protein n=1 Tax=Micavibrio aeruginosavorus TaxID=349221 RepID=A0A7T5R0L8_9BACT|nr:MAG: hypothetical protein HYS17_07180 [Micavibrio aeruginosavorus]